MKKSWMAVLIALLMTACVGASMFAIGGAALFNRNGVVASSSPVQVSEASNVAAAPQADQVAQLQSLVSQYQDHERQYQQREQQLQGQLAQANEQIQQDQQMLQQVQTLLAVLQQRGMIRITEDGRVFINQ